MPEARAAAQREKNNERARSVTRVNLVGFQIELVMELSMVNLIPLHLHMAKRKQDKEEREALAATPDARTEAADARSAAQREKNRYGTLSIVGLYIGL